MFLLAIILLTNYAHAQSTIKIYGHVYDSSTSHALVGATVIIDETRIVTSTNEFGYFQFDNIISGNYDIFVNYIGYKSKTLFNIEVQKDIPTEVNIYLDLSSIKLEDIIVSSQSAYTLKNDVTKINRKDIEQNNYQSLGEILFHTSELDVTKIGVAGSSQKISIRGSENNQVLLLLDGVPINDQFGGEADLSQIPINIIENIEIYKGGNSALFGSGAIGGVVNVITRRQFDNELKVNLTTGSFNYVNFEPTFSGDFYNFSYLVSYNFTKSLGNFPYTYTNTSGKTVDGIRINSDFLSQNIFSRINYKLNNYSFSINALKSFSEKGLPGMSNALTAFARSSTQNNSFGASIKSTFENIVFEVNYNFSNAKTENSNLYSENALIKFNRYPQYHYKYETRSSILNSFLYVKPSDWWFVVLGYNGKWINYNDYNFLPSSNQVSTYAQDYSNGIYLRQDFSLNNKQSIYQISVTPVIRYDNIEMSNGDSFRNENQLSPSLSLSLLIGGENKLYIRPSLSKSFRVPTFSDLFFQDVRIEGRPDLLPEKSLNREISLGIELNNSGKITAEYTYYKNTIDNMIVWKLGSFEIFRPFNNNAEITGQSYSLRYQTTDNSLILNINYSHVLPLDKNNQTTTRDKIIPYHAQHTVKLNSQYQIGDFLTKLNYRFVGKRYVTVANTVELAPYNLFDLSLQQNINLLSIKTTLSFTINNITNEQYELVRNYPMPGREFRLGLTLTY